MEIDYFEEQETDHPSWYDEDNYNNDFGYEFIKKTNKEVLKQFKIYLESEKLSEKVIKRHLKNAEFYINDCLTYEKPTFAECGWKACYLNYAFDYFLPYKCLFGSVNEVTNIIASIKKSYKMLLEQGSITEEMYDDFLYNVKIATPYWKDYYGGFNEN